MLPRVTQPAGVNSRSVPCPLSPQGWLPGADSSTVPGTTWALTPGTSRNIGAKLWVSVWLLVEPALL